MDGRLQVSGSLATAGPVVVHGVLALDSTLTVSAGDTLSVASADSIRLGPAGRLVVEGVLDTSEVTVPQGRFTYDLAAGWHLVSLPVDMGPTGLHSVFANAISCLRFAGGYLQDTMLVAKRGYWLSLDTPGSQDDVVAPAVAQVDTMLMHGWHVVGMPLEGFRGENADDAVGGIQLHSFDGAYHLVTDTTQMHPGNGYWAYTTEPDPLLLPRQGLLAKPVRQAVVATEPLPTLWVTDGRATAGLALGVPVEDLVEMPPLPPAPEILDLRCLVGGVGYYQVPATPGAPVPVRVQGEHLQLWVDGPEETTADWEVTIDGVVGPGTGVRVPVTAGAPITVAWTGVPPAPPGNFPNPFNPSTTIPFVVHSSGVVRVVVYDMLGQQVRELVHGQREAGRHTVVWDGRDGQGREVGNGVYFCRVEVPDAAPVTRKLLLLR